MLDKFKVFSIFQMMMQSFCVKIVLFHIFMCVFAFCTFNLFVHLTRCFRATAGALVPQLQAKGLWVE